LIGTIPGTLAGIITLSRLYDRLGSALDFWLKLAIGLLLSTLGITVSGAVLVAGGLLILRLFPRVP
jgi:hypothetical protein